MMTAFVLPDLDTRSALPTPTRVNVCVVLSELVPSLAVRTFTVPYPRIDPFVALVVYAFHAGTAHSPCRTSRRDIQIVPAEQVTMLAVRLFCVAITAVAHRVAHVVYTCPPVQVLQPVVVWNVVAVARFLAFSRFTDPCAEHETMDRCRQDASFVADANHEVTMSVSSWTYNPAAAGLPCCVDVGGCLDGSSIAYKEPAIVTGQLFELFHNNHSTHRR